MFLESPANPRIRAWSQLKTPKGRRQQRMFLAEGARLAEDALRSSLSVEALLWNSAAGDLPASLQDAAAALGTPVVEVSPPAFAQVADTSTPQGVIAIVRMPPLSDANEQTEFALLLDGVRDPGNAGTLLRSADAFGVGQVCFGNGSVDPYSPKVVRASMGGVLRLPVVACEAVDHVGNWRKKWPEGAVVVASARTGVACHEAQLRLPLLLVVGSEADGVSTAVSGLATTAVHIPMIGAADSLNVGVAASVLLYEVHRRRLAK